MTWLTWRQFRTSALVVLAALALVAVPTVVTGRQIRAWEAACTSASPCLGIPVEAYMSRYMWLLVLLRGGLLALPVVLGIFWGAPLVAREIDSGTYRLAWTQSTSRVRWLTVKIVVVGLASLLATAVLSWMTTWWFGPADRTTNDKFIASIFDVRDVVPVGYAAFAFALGLSAGIVIRRVLPAMATTLAVFIAVRMAVQMLVRPHYRALLSESGPLLDPSGGNTLKQGAALPSGSWAVATQIFDPSGHLLRDPLRFGPDATCAATQNCLDGYTQHVLYQPGSRYWSFQWIETGLFTALALLLVGFSYWWLTGRRAPGRAPRPARGLAPVTSVATVPRQRPVTLQRPAARSMSLGRIWSPCTRSPSWRYSLVTHTCVPPTRAAVSSARSRST